jgi:hypothetical protein
MRQGLHAWPQQPPHQENGVSHHKMNSPTIIEQELRLCGKCCRALPVSEFRRRSKSSESRSSDCRACHNHYEHARIQKQRKQVRRRIVRKAADEVARCRTVDQAALIISMLPAAFGGVEKLFRFWMDEVQRGGHPHEIVRYCELWYRFELLQDSAATHRLHQLNSPEGRAALREELHGLIRKHPEIAVQAAKEIGCEIARGGSAFDGTVGRNP